MTHIERSDGIFQSGKGQIINNGAMAIGAEARASHQAAPADRAVAEDLQKLRLLLAEYGSELSEASQTEAEEKLTKVADELDRAAPHRGRIMTAVSRLTVIFASVAPLVEGLERLRQAIEKVVR